MHAAMAADAVDEHSAQTSQHSSDDGGPAGHLCCTHFTAVMVAVFPTAAAPVAAQALATPAPRAISHLPEPPQQPPRATPL
jgi:hypothetical protein